MNLSEILSNPVMFGKVWTIIIVIFAMIIYIYDKQKEREAKKEYVNLLKKTFEKDKEFLQNLKIKGGKKVFINLMEFGQLVSYYTANNLFVMLVRVGFAKYRIVLAKKENVKIFNKEIHIKLESPFIIDNYIGEAKELKEYVDPRFWLSYNEYLLERISMISDNLIEGNVVTQNQIKYLRELIEYEVSKKLKPYADLINKGGFEDAEEYRTFRRKI